jgi:hypothetical protein
VAELYPSGDKKWRGLTPRFDARRAGGVKRAHGARINSERAVRRRLYRIFRIERELLLLPTTHDAPGATSALSGESALF